MAKQTWSQKLAETRHLKSKGAALVYDRVKLYQEIYRDDEYIADCDQREVNPEDELNEECGDLCCGVLVLFQVLKTFPAKDEWQRRRLEHMVAEVVERNKRERTATANNRKAWKTMYEEAISEARRLQRENELLTARLEELERVLKVQAA